MSYRVRDRIGELRALAHDPLEAIEEYLPRVLYYWEPELSPSDADYVMSQFDAQTGTFFDE